jgi:hypothetical protein
MLISDRGRPVAALVDVHQDGANEVASTLVRQGIGEWGGGKPRGLLDPPRVPGGRAVEVVLEDRR